MNQYKETKNNLSRQFGFISIRARFLLFFVCGLDLLVWLKAKNIERENCDLIKILVSIKIKEEARERDENLAQNWT